MLNVTKVEIQFPQFGIPDQGIFRAYATIEIASCFVVHDLRILERRPGHFDLAMPSRKLWLNCSRCNAKNGKDSRFCCQCGLELAFVRNDLDEPFQKVYTDIAHPINTECRIEITEIVLKEFHRLKQSA